MTVGQRAAALRPADDGEPAHALGVQPRAHLACGKIDIGLGAFSRPCIMRAIELRRTHPVLQGKFAAVLDAEPPLLGTVDEEQATKRPESLPAQRVLALLFENCDALAGVGQFSRGNETRKPAADDHRICSLGHAAPQISSFLTCLRRSHDLVYCRTSQHAKLRRCACRKPRKLLSGPDCRVLRPGPHMLIRHKRRWEMPESAATPESLFFDRRHLLAAGGALIGASALPRFAQAAADDPSASLYPAKRNDAFKLDRDLTAEDVSGNYNNFYEYGTSKQVTSAAQQLKTRPWTVKVDGLVGKPKEYAIDDLIKAFPLEERLYRHRCVEAWSMAVPWTGFPLKALVAMAEPQAGAKYIRFETFNDKKMAPGQRGFMFTWPYVEGLTMAEAANDLAFIVTGVYGKPLPNQFGAPIRLATPWKYGFKSAKSIVRISFVAERPPTFWENLQSSEYGFWANVNPAVPHPRWSQATEEVIGTGKRVPTIIFNGYGAEVAGIYKGLESERLYV